MPTDDTTIDWSYTNSRLYSSCPRALFYRHWRREGPSEQSGQSDEFPAQQEFNSGGALVGTAIHEALRKHIAEWSRGGTTGLQITQTTAESYIQQASDGRSGDARIDVGSLVTTAESHIKRFFRYIWPSIRSQRYITHEETSSFDLDKTTVWVRPDLCTRAVSDDKSDSSQFVIYDWKSRQPQEFEDPSLQLQVYALWAYREFEPEPERISPRLVFTSTGEVKRYHVDLEVLDRVKSRIRDDTNEWGSPDDESAFPPDPESEKCSRCSYLHSCVAGQREINRN